MRCAREIRFACEMPAGVSGFISFHISASAEIFHNAEERGIISHTSAASIFHFITQPNKDDHREKNKVDHREKFPCVTAFFML